MPDNTPPPPRRRWGLIIAAAAVALALAFVLWWRARPAPPTLAVVVEGPLEVTVQEQARTRVRGAVTVSAPVAGRWVPVALDPGDAVRAGARLGTLYPVPLDAAALAQAQGAHDAARAALGEATAQRAALAEAQAEAVRARRRVERLEAAGGASPEALEQARTIEAERNDALAAATARMAAAEAAVRGAEAVVAGQGGGARGARPLVAPRGGTVLLRLEEQERVLPAGTPLVRLGNLDALEAVIRVLSSDAALVRPGTRVRFTVGASPTTVAGAPADTLVGAVVRVDPAARTIVSALGVEEQRVDVVAALPARRPALGEGHALEADVVLWRGERVVQLPAAALVRGDTGWVAHVWRRGRAVPVPVTLGARGAAMVEVRAGVAVGDSVVLYPGQDAR
ncbi:MAG: HlyD family efflux transporter periplasmic adaptor subunit [Gemmatimonadetes bacterium]|nr:HlyD family efflux transporter periplasmic adaptor subunit [Gemmatimonadota bacterium]